MKNGSFCVVYYYNFTDQTIVATSIAGIGSALRVKGSLTWISTSYLLTTTVFQPIAGRLAVRVNPPHLACISLTQFARMLSG
jgi:MFS family permease